jgi:hypothetical protein
MYLYMLDPIAPGTAKKKKKKEVKNHSPRLEGGVKCSTSADAPQGCEAHAYLRGTRLQQAGHG